MSNFFFRRRTSSSTELTEAALAKACAACERRAQQELYTRYSGALLAVCLRYMGDRAQAEDMLQDAFLHIFDCIDKFTYQKEGSLGSWMKQVTRNDCLQVLRKNKQIVDSLDDHPEVHEDAVESPDVSAINNMNISELIALIGELPDGYRTVINLVLLDGVSHKEAASLMGINEKSSSSQLLRAKAALAKKITHYIEEKEI